MRLTSVRAAGVIVVVASSVFTGTALAVASPANAKALTTCESSDPELAERLMTELDAAIAAKPDGMGFSISDPLTQTVCHYGSDQQIKTASTIKVALVAALLHLAQEEGRELTQAELDNAFAAITSSDNAAATAIYDQLGPERIEGFLATVGMPGTMVRPTWGSSVTTSADQVVLLNMLTNPGEILSDDRRAYLLDLMSQVVPDQRWGTPAGAPATVTVHVKNGWYPEKGWVSSLGTFDGTDRNYVMAVLTGNSTTLDEGVERIEKVSRVVHTALDS